MEDPQQSSQKAVFFMFLLALQFGLQPILWREFVKKDVVIDASLVFVQELTKLVLALIVLQLETGIGKAFKGWTLLGSIKGAALRE